MRSAIKKHLLHLVGILFPHINDDARSKSLQMIFYDLLRIKVMHFVIHLHAMCSENFNNLTKF